MKNKILKSLGKLGRFAILAAFVINVLAPIYWLFITSIKAPNDIATLDIQYWPKNPTFENYLSIWQHSEFPTYTMNSVIVAGLVGLVVTIIAVFGGYALARFNFKAKKGTLFAFLVSQMIPTTIFLIPLFIIFSKVRLIDTLAGLVILGVICNMPFCVVTMQGFFANIPVVLEESATLEGCNRMQVLRHIVLPIMLPGIIAVFIFAFIGAWNALLGPVMLISSELKKTIPIALNSYIGRTTVDWGRMSAGGILALLPTMIMFAFAQKYIVDGLTSGSVKE